ncbi:tetratricopeptide repeat protein [Anaerobium acetethylicum]|uniref:Uncharacterized protein n=1 Tax=Anaerobium acetethylicum TaxID=1619234 RepID=A0A1D3TW22_9FIRM|nr:hypothetical protein [Anaerobium acetethylicum]SCP98379.1 hypothetical protein SAMN05421730_10203 [Anaerobium acetethylicum]
MKKVIFCNIAWMKEYKGITEDDKPKNGGAYVGQNQYAHEVHNFVDYNKFCYGYVSTNGENHIERFGKIYEQQDEARDVLVVWVATDGIGKNRIVGWYKNASMFRYYQEIFNSNMGGLDLGYVFRAKAEECYLLPEKKRTFLVPRAQKEGQGRGMGQANIWYADSEYAKQEYVPRVIEYINQYDGEFVHVAFTENEIHAEAQTEETDINKLLEISQTAADPLKALRFANTAMKLDYSYKTVMNRGDAMLYSFRYDEAVEDYKCAMDLNESDTNARTNLMDIYIMLEKNEEAIKMGEELEKLETDEEILDNIKLNLASLYCIEQDFEQMEKRLVLIAKKEIAEYNERIKVIREIAQEKKRYMSMR